MAYELYGGLDAKVVVRIGPGHYFELRQEGINLIVEHYVSDECVRAEVVEHGFGVRSVRQKVVELPMRYRFAHYFQPMHDRPEICECQRGPDDPLHKAVPLA